MRFEKLILVVALTAIVAGAVFSYAFRRVEIPGAAAHGAFFLKYRWGKPAELLFDANQDETIDSRRIIDPNAGDFAPNTNLESYESSHCNGAFDLRIRLFIVFIGHVSRRLGLGLVHHGGVDGLIHMP